LEETIPEPGYQSDGAETISGRPSRIISGRRAYLPVFLEGFGRAILEESELHNNTNGDAGITNSGRLFRVGVKTIAYFMRQNSINLSNTPGAKWKALSPMEIIMDQGTSCDNCDPFWRAAHGDRAP
jgi:hypothetical protein